MITPLFGLNPEDLKNIYNVLKKQNLVEQAYIFGSRAKGSNNPGSDVDIALKGKFITQENITQISYVLNEETNMPYRFDLINYNTVSEPALKEHIDRVGKVFYEKNS